MTEHRELSVSFDGTRSIVRCSCGLAGAGLDDANARAALVWLHREIVSVRTAEQQPSVDDGGAGCVSV